MDGEKEGQVLGKKIANQERDAEQMISENTTESDTQRRGEIRRGESARGVKGGSASSEKKREGEGKVLLGTYHGRAIRKHDGTLLSHP